MESEDYKIEVLDDDIYLKQTGILITTSWEIEYGNVLDSILNIKSHYQEGVKKESLILNE